MAAVFWIHGSECYGGSDPSLSGISNCAPPNMRLKLTGLPLRESAVPSPAVRPPQGRAPCAGGHVARSLSAIR